MTLYRVYYITDSGMKLVCYIEVPDSTPRQQVKDVREEALKTHYIRPDQIVRIVRDC